MRVDKVLVAFDGSGHSAQAFEFACDLAAGHDARLYIVGVCEPQAKSLALTEMAAVEHTAPERHHPETPHLARVPTWIVDAMDAAQRDADTSNIAEAMTAQILQRAGLRAESRGVKGVTLLQRHGRPADEILRCAKELGVDVVFMGNRGLRDFESAIFGSVSHQVAHNLREVCTCVTVSAATRED